VTTPSSWITPKAAKGVGSAIAGRGLVASEAIGKDEVVAVKGGHIVSTATLRSLSDWRQLDLQRKYRGYFSWYLQRRIQDQ
jgi:hypothetical protein